MLNRFKYILLITLLACVSNAWAKTPPPGSGSDVPANILLMLDTSGSMDEDLPGPDTQYPMDVAFDSHGNIYVAKFYDYVEKYDSSGNFVTSWGGEGNGNGKFEYVFGIAVDANDNVYVSDYQNSRVQKFDSNGNYISKFSVSGGTVYGIETDSSGNVYVLNANGAVRKYSSTGSLLQNWTNSGGYSLAINNSISRAYIADYNNKKIETYSLTGSLVSSFSLSWRPFGIDVDTSGNLYISREDNDTIYKYSPSGTLQQTFGGTGSALGKFNSPRGVEVRTSDNKAYVADFNNHRIQSANGNLLLYQLPQTRLDAMKAVVKAIVTNSDLTSGANFGLMVWNTNATMKVNISSTGASQIYNMIDSLSAGGNTYLNNAMNLANSYFTGSSTPIASNASCQQTIMIVISDGYWQDNPNTTAHNMYTNLGIKTYTIGFTTTDDSNYTALSQTAGSYPDSPLFAEDESTLLDDLSSIIRNVISAQFTFTVPIIIPGITDSDHIIQSTFSFEKNHQWKGHLYKYSLDDSGYIGSLIWDAGDKLNQKAADSRQIWTVANALTQSVNNFTVTNIDRLRPALSENATSSLTDNTLTNLINFVRGKDSYSEYPNGVDDDNTALLSGERWKLADIYHSKAVAVGAPSSYYSDQAASYSESYYRYVNNYSQFIASGSCGTTCSLRPEVIYVGDNDGMLHAFDSSTGDEKWAFIPAPILPYLKGVISTTSGQSISIYGVDGSPAVKDIFINGAWKTVLLGGLRQGASGYYALDITNPNSPTHLFSFAYNKYTNKINYWSSGNVRTDYTLATVPTQYDYSALGESWSDPLILKVTIGGVEKWVGVFGGGYNNNTTGTYGSAVYIIDLADGGKVLKKITIPDNNASNGILNSVPPRLTAITADTTTSFNHAGAMLYFTDIEGSLWKINLTDSGTLYQTTRVFDTQATYDNDRLCYYQTSPSILTDGRLMQYFGTGDLNRIGRTSTSIANRAYGIIDPNYPDFVTQSSPYTVTDLQNLSGSNSVCPTSSQKGWYINLDSNEKISATAAVNDTEVIFSRYTPNTNDLCQAGTSKISEHDFACGNKIRDVSLGTGMATEAVVYKNKVYIGISSDAANSSLPSGFTKQGNLIVGTPAVSSTPSVKVEYWKEDF